jgi:hypothetical protein
MAENSKDVKSSEMTVERFESLSTDEAHSKNALHKTQTMGTVTITDEVDIYLVPAPSADPRGICTFSISTEDSNHDSRSPEPLQVAENCVHLSCLNL